MDVYGSVWCESQEPVVKKKRRRSSMLLPIRRVPLIEEYVDSPRSVQNSEDYVTCNLRNTRQEEDSKTENRPDTNMLTEFEATACHREILTVRHSEEDKNTVKTVSDHTIERIIVSVNESKDETSKCVADNGNVLSQGAKHHFDPNISALSEGLNSSPFTPMDDLNSAFVTNIKTPNNAGNAEDSCYEDECITPTADANRTGSKDSPMSMSPDFPASPPQVQHYEPNLLNTTGALSMAESLIDNRGAIDKKDSSDLSLSDKENSFSVMNESVEKSRNDSPGFISMCKALAGKVVDFVKTSPSYLSGSIPSPIDHTTDTCASPVLKLMDKQPPFDKSYLTDLRNIVVPETQCLVYNALEDDDTPKNKPCTSEAKGSTLTSCGSVQMPQKNLDQAVIGSAKKMVDRKAFHDTFNAVSQQLYKSKQRSVSESVNTNEPPNELKKGENKRLEKEMVATKRRSKSLSADYKIETERSGECVNRNQHGGVDIPPEQINELSDKVDGNPEELVIEKLNAGPAVNTIAKDDENVTAVLLQETISVTEINQPYFQSNETVGETISDNELNRQLNCKNSANDDAVLTDNVSKVIDEVSKYSNEAVELDLKVKDSKEVRRRRKRRALVIEQNNEDECDQELKNQSETPDSLVVAEKLPRLVEKAPSSKIDSFKRADPVPEPKPAPKKKARLQSAKFVFEEKCEIDSLSLPEEPFCSKPVSIKTVNSNEKQIEIDTKKQRGRRRRSFGITSTIPTDTNKDEIPEKTVDITISERETLTKKNSDKVLGQNADLAQKIAEMNIKSAKKTDKVKKTSIKPTRRRRSANIKDLKPLSYANTTDNILDLASSPTEDTRLSPSFERPAVSCEVVNETHIFLGIQTNRTNSALNDNHNSPEGVHTDTRVEPVDTGSATSVLTRLTEDIAQVNLSDAASAFIPEASTSDVLRTESGGDLSEMVEERSSRNVTKRRRRSADAASLKMQMILEDISTSETSPGLTTPVKAARKRKHVEESLEQIENIYRNKNFVKPEEKKPWQTINESPNTSTDVFGKKKLQRHIDFERPTQLKLRRRLQRAVKNGWDPKKKKKGALKDDIVKDRLDKIWTDMELENEATDSLQSQLRKIIETQ